MGKDLVFMPECHSTNTSALERCQQSPPPSDGTVIITDHQHAGRGQRGNVWHAAPGENLTFSVIVKPAFLSVADQFLLNVCVALAVADFLQHAGCKQVTVKWPNDIYAGAKKLGGILIECQIRGNELLWTVIGIGLNINQKKFQISSASSLVVEVPGDYDLNECFSEVVSRLEARYLQLRRGAKRELVKEYESRMYWINEVHEFESESRGRFVGSIAGVDALGRLRILIDGDESFFGMKEVAFIN